jgi:hypothetical protein
LLSKGFLFCNRTQKVKKQTKIFREKITDFVLKSNSSTSFLIDGFFKKDFTVEIENHENQSLAFSKIEVVQNSLFVISDLKANEKYLVIIDSTLSKPQYDLEGFIKESKMDYQQATITDLQKIKVKRKMLLKNRFGNQKHLCGFVYYSQLQLLVILQ